jgi:hypothetical protein
LTQIVKNCFDFKKKKTKLLAGDLPEFSLSKSNDDNLLRNVGPAYNLKKKIVLHDLDGKTKLNFEKKNCIKQPNTTIIINNF